MPKRPSQESSHPSSGLRRWWPWRSKTLAAGPERAVAPLIDLFVATTLIDQKLTLEEIDTMLDFLRVSYPEQDHGWLSRHLQRAVRNPRSVMAAAAAIAPSTSVTQRQNLLFELFILLQNNGTPSPGDTLKPIGDAFEQSAFCDELPDFLSGKEETAAWKSSAQTSLERLIIGGGQSEIDLDDDETLEVLIIRSAGQIWLLNQGSLPLRARGRLLRPFHWLRLNSGHDLRGEQHTFSHQELAYFLDSKKRGLGLPTYLSVEDGLLLADRSRSRDSMARLRFGLVAELEALTDGACSLEGRTLAKGDTAQLADHELISVTDCGSFPIRELRRRSLELGGHFELAPQRQTLRASNQGNDVELKLTRNQAPSFELEIRYSHQLREGQVVQVSGRAKASLEGKPLRPGTPLKDGDLIRLSPVQSIRCRFSANTLEEELTHISELRIEGLSHFFPDGSHALSHIDLDLKRGEMLAIIGPSGCGKSTLLSILAGHQTPSRGKIRYNGMSLYRWRKRLLPLIAHLPHEQALNPDLTVREHLAQSLIAREPRLAKPAIKRRLSLTLDTLDLHHRADYRVGSPDEKLLSAGERSRLNLGLDLVGSGNVFLLDEPIAGLSSKDSEHIIENLHQLSREKLVVATLHRPNPSLLKHFSRLLVLDYGGHLAYCGPANQAAAYFREAAKDLGLGKVRGEKGTDLIFEVLESAHLYEGAARRRNSTLWSDRFESHRLMQQIKKGSHAPARSQMTSRGRAEDNLPIPEITAHAPRSWFRLLANQLKRDLLPRCRSRSSLLILVLQPLTLGLLIAGTLKYATTETYQFHAAPHIPAFLFLSAVVAMFFGLTTAATDLLKDGPMLRRERNARPSRSAYLGAKFLCYLLTSSIQCLIFLLVSLKILEFPSTSWEHLPLLTLTALCGCGLAMISSLLVQTERASLAAVPLLLVPQVLLAGALVPFGQMNTRFPAGLSPAAEQSAKSPNQIPWLAKMNPLRYSFESLMLTEATRNPFAQTENKISEFRDQRIASNQDTDIAKTALMSLLFLNTETRADASQSLKKLTKAVRKERPELIEEASANSSANGQTLDKFFVNQTCSDAHLEAETRRLSTERMENGAVFLGKKRPCFGDQVSTLGFNYALISSIAFVCWLVAAMILRHRYEKT